MRTLKSTLLALTIALASSVALTGCFVDDEEVFGHLEQGTTGESQAESETNDEEWD